jgi:hypothetical protein
LLLDEFSSLSDEVREVEGRNSSAFLDAALIAAAPVKTNNTVKLVK